MRIHNEQFVSSATTLGSDYTSDALWLGHVANYSIQIAYTGDDASNLNGTFKLQGSNDFGRSEVSRADSESLDNWTDIDNSSVSVSSLAYNPTTELWNESNAGYRWVRLVFTNTSGTGSLTSATINTKGI